jgi:hypothetical protein
MKKCGSGLIFRQRSETISSNLQFQCNVTTDNSLFIFAQFTCNAQIWILKKVNSKISQGIMNRRSLIILILNNQ